MKKYAIIVAGGKGERFGSDVPKQFLELHGKPILMHTIDKFNDADSSIEILVVLPEKQLEYWSKICKKYSYTTPCRLIVGGNNRYESVSNALNSITDNESLVAIHDGVRPLVSTTLIIDAFAQAQDNGNAIPIIKVTDSIRKINTDGSNSAIDRSTLRAVQTPQTFRTSELKAAYALGYDETFTDDASVYEHNGGSIYLMPGDNNNIKITHRKDIAIAEIILKNA